MELKASTILFQQMFCILSNYSGLGTAGRDGKKLPDAGLYTVPNWPPSETTDQVGQPTGICLDIYDNPVIFHRGDRTWDQSTFNR